MMKAYLLILAIIFTVSPPAFPASLINVPLDHWSYQFVERLRARGILGEYLINSKPYSRGEVADMIAHTSRLLANGCIHLTSVEMGLLEELKREFAMELAELGEPDIKNRKHLVDWTDEERRLIIELGLGHKSSFNDFDGNTYLNTLNVTFYGDIWKGLSFYSHSWASYQAGEEPPFLGEKYPEYIWRYPWSDSSDTYIAFGNSKVSLQTGKDTILWGVGNHGVIGLTGVDPAFSSLKFHTKMWKVNFTSLVGFPRDNTLKKYQSDVPKKYLSAHRFEITPVPGICISWQEAYVYAERLHIELMLPMMPYQMAEDYLGEIGNNTMEGDLVVSIIPNTKLYSALYLDDFHPDMNPFTEPGFGWAILSGASIVDPFGIDDTDVILEYARIEPWAYTHKGLVQVPPIPTAYNHFDKPLGHWIGQNSDDLFTQIGWQINKHLYGNVSYNRIRHGEVGGNIYDYDLYDYAKKKFLGGIVETKREFGIGVKYTTFGQFDIAVGYRYIKTQNRQREEAKLPKSDSRKQPWKAGWNTTENKLEVGLQFKY